MNCDAFKPPTSEGVRKACKEFDADEETKIAEAALIDLFGKYPTNTNEAHVLLKVVALYVFYSTRIPTRAQDSPNVFDIAGCIPKLNVDQGFEESSLKIVNAISITQFPSKRRVARFSFATKYANWHRQDVYPMWDGRVQNYFTCLRKLHRSDWDRFSDGFKLSLNDWGYPEFHGLMTRFRDHYGLRSFTFKEIDKFLWLHGGEKV